MDILEIHKKYGIEIPEDKRDDFNKDFRTHYKSAGELKKLKDDLTAAQNKINTSTDFEGQYNTLFRKYETDIAAKDAEIANLVRDRALDKGLAGVEFANARIRDSVVNEIRSKNFKMTDNGELDGLNDFLKELKKNEPDIFKAGASGNTWAGGSDTPKVEPKVSADIFKRCY